MKKLLLALPFVLLGCVEEAPSQKPAPEPSTKASAPAVQYFMTEAQGRAAFSRAVLRVKPVARSVCQDFSADLPAKFCDFQFNILNAPNQPPNAFQSLDGTGRPVVTFNSNMLRAVKNDHEVAFILGHEAGHQIARHLLKKRSNAVAGAILGGLIAGATGIDPSAGIDIGGSIGGFSYSKTFELEADRLGTHIASRAGYNPLIGAEAFARFGGSNAILSTHPASEDRQRTVKDTYAKIRSGNTSVTW